MPLSRSSQGTANRKASSAAHPAAATKEAAHAAEVLPQLADAGIARSADGGYLLNTDSFKFRQHMERTMRRIDARDDLIQNLAEEWEDPASLRQALSPMRTPGAGAASAGDGVKDSLVRMLLHVDPLQTDLATKLLEKLPELEDEMDTDGNSMPLPRLIVSQFRWLEYVVDGEKMVDSVRETMEVHDPACSTVPRPTPAQYAMREPSAPCTTTCPILVSPVKHRS